MNKVLIVEDDEDFRELLRLRLMQDDFMVDEAPNLETAAWKIEKGDYDAFLLDVKLPDGSSIDLLEKFPGKLASRVIVITANPTIPGVVEVIKKGVFNYLEKPVDEGLLIAQLKKIMELNRLRNHHQSMVIEMGSNFTFFYIICKSKQMEEVIHRAQILAATNNTISLQGETGVGKEVLAHSIHNQSNRKNEIFLPVDCAAIPAELFESELFGFEKGACCGAVDS